jgi:PAS domain S-box-containing protein
MRNLAHPIDESRRVAALRALKVLDTPPVEELDRITRLATRLFDVPISLVSLVDRKREWFKSRVGLDIAEMDRTISFCTHTIRHKGLMVVEDARQDPRFRVNPAVLGEPNIVFYAGYNIHSREGYALGTLCVIDHVPRTFSAADAQALKDLAGIVQEYFHQVEVAGHARMLGQDSRQLESALRESERRYMALFNNKTSGMAHMRFVTDAQGRAVNYYLEAVNDTYLRIMGVERQRVEGRLVTDAFPGIANLGFDFLQPYAAVALQGEEASLERYFRPTDQWFSVYAYSPAHGECITIFTEITEQKRTEAALREREQVLRATFEQAAIGIVHVGPDGRFLRSNQKFLDMLGFTEQELIGKRFTDITPPEEHDSGMRVFHRALAGDLATFTLEKRYIRKDGAVICCRISVTSVRDARTGAPQYNLVMVEDITARKHAEEALRRERAQLQAIMDNAPAIIGIKDLEGRVIVANRVFVETLGRRSADEVVGRSLFDLLPTELAEQHRANDCAALSAGAPIRVEEVAPVGDGGLRTYETMKFPVRDSVTGQAFGICSISTDITERKQAEAERECLMAELEQAAISANRSRAQLEAVFESIDDGVAVFDTEGNIVMLNQALARINRFASVDDMRQNISYFGRMYELSLPDGKRLALEEWPGARVMRGETFTDWEVHARRLDIGRSWYFSYSGKPVYDENGRQVLSVLVNRDVTARHQLEQELQKAQRDLEARVERRTAELRAANEALNREKERTRVVLETATDAYVAADEEGRVRDWNRAAEKMFGWARHEVLGQAITALIIPQRYQAEHEQGLRRLCASGERRALNHVTELLARHRDGHEFPVDMSISANAFGEGWTISAFIRDISERKRGEEALRRAHDELSQSLAAEQAAARAAEAARLRAEEAMRAAEAANRAKSEFLATMSHEIRTPLNGVIGFNGLLLDGPLTEDKRQYAELARQSGESLLHLLNDFLDFSKIEAGHLELEPLDFDPHLEIDHAMGLVRDSARRKGLELTSQVQAPTRVRGDAARLRQILVNLLSNAVKFTERGRVTLSCEELTRSDGKVWLLFEVQDTGLGISVTARERLFQPFSQADASTTRRFGGTGLGLAICKRLAVAMGGRIGVRSEPGRGSTFWVELPFDLREMRGAPAAARPPEMAPALPEQELRGRVLVVEDNPVSQLMAVEMLKKMGCRVDAVGNGLEAVEAMRRLPYDLVLMDCDMPVMNGFDATATIRAEEPGGQRVPIVAITASALKGDSERCLAVGMDDFMSKPVRFSELCQMVDKWLPPR